MAIQRPIAMTFKRVLRWVAWWTAFVGAVVFLFLLWAVFMFLPL